MKSILIISSFLVILLLGCGTNQNNENEANKEEPIIINCIDSVFPNGYCDKYCERFYPSGELMETYTTKNDSILCGSRKFYYKNGYLQDSTFYAGGSVYGIYKSFYSDGTKKRFCDYVIIGDDGEYSYRNQLVEYDSLTGKINKEKSFYYSFELSETIKDGDSITVVFNFDNPMYKDTAYLEIGNYDEFFRITKEDKEKIRIIPVINQKAEFKVKVEKRDYYFIRGIIYNFDKADATKRRLFYFYEKYEVS